MSSPVIPVVIDRHAEEAAFLWHQRSLAVGRPQYTLRSLAELDQRVEAHVDGLRVAGEPGRRRVWQEFEDHPDPGETFVAALIALEAASTTHLRPLFEQAATSPKHARAVVSAVGWLSDADAALALPMLHAWGEPVPRFIGLAGSAVRRVNPGSAVFTSLFRKPEPYLRARTFRAVGELGAITHLTSVLDGCTDADPACRFWANWSAALMVGHPAAVSVLRDAAAKPGPFQARAVQLAARRTPPPRFREWLRNRTADPDRRTTVVAAGAFGDTAAIPWLLDLMTDAALARLAGEAFTSITGLDLTQNPYTGSRPAETADRPTDDPTDEDVSSDPDDDLPWPEPVAVRKWWGQHQGSFPRDTRLLLGKPLTPQWLRQVLLTGGQRYRAAAALELAIAQPGTPMFEVRAPGRRQQQLLAHG